MNVDELSGLEFAVEYGGGGADLDDDGAFAFGDIDFGEVTDGIEHGATERLCGCDGVAGDASDDGVEVDESVRFEWLRAVPWAVTEVGAGDDGAGSNFGHGHWKGSAFACWFDDGSWVVGKFHEVARCERADDAEDSNGQHPGCESHGCAPENLLDLRVGWMVLEKVKWTGPGSW